MIQQVEIVKYLTATVKNGKVIDLRLSNYPSRPREGIEVMKICVNEKIYVPELKEHLRVINRRRKDNTNSK